MALTSMVSALIIAVAITTAQGKSLPKAAATHGIGHGSHLGAELGQDPFMLLEDPLGSDEIELADWLKVDEEGSAEPLRKAPVRADIDGRIEKVAAAANATTTNNVSPFTVWLSKLLLRTLFLLVVGLGIERYKSDRDRSEKKAGQQQRVVAVAPKKQPQPKESSRDACGCTALHMAVHQGCSGADLEALLKSGADVNVRDDWDESALHFAARRGDVALCKLLLLAGADIDALNANGETPLLVAGLAKQEVAAEFLLDEGATVAGASADELPGTLNILLFCRMMEHKN